MEMISIPEFLYRGDADTRNIRTLKETLHLYQLQTNLLGGGNGHEIFKSPLLKLVSEHVEPGWAKTHFLSFSERKTTAMRFALHCESEEVAIKMTDYSTYYEQDKDWDFALIEIDTTRIKWTALSVGIYWGEYIPMLEKFKHGNCLYSVMLINVCESVQSLDSLSNILEVLANAKRDTEWLLLPATMIE